MDTDNVKIKELKIYITIFVLLGIAIVTWLLKYYAQKNDLPPLLIEALGAIFSATSAACLGGIVFELMLRNEILNEVSRTLAEIITTDKSIVKKLFTAEKRNHIIETMLQVQIGNDLLGNALYRDFIFYYLKSGQRVQQFRREFSDHIKLSKIDHPDNKLLKKYWAVIDRIEFQGIMPNVAIFTVGCAKNQAQLENFFNNPNCIYRWLFEDDRFGELIDMGYGFSIDVFVNDEKCVQLNKGELSEQGFEIQFKNPLFTQEQMVNNEIFAKLKFVVHTLQSVNKKAITIHLAYPVQGVKTSLDYKDTNIQDVTALHFLTGGERNPKIENRDKDNKHELYKTAREGKVELSIQSDKWIFPDSGIAFIW